MVRETASACLRSLHGLPQSRCRPVGCSPTRLGSIPNGPTKILRRRDTRSQASFISPCLSVLYATRLCCGRRESALSLLGVLFPRVRGNRCAPPRSGRVAQPLGSRPTERVMPAAAGVIFGSFGTASPTRLVHARAGVVVRLGPSASLRPAGAGLVGGASRIVSQPAAPDLAFSTAATEGITTAPARRRLPSSRRPQCAPLRSPGRPRVDDHLSAGALDAAKAAEESERKGLKTLARLLDNAGPLNDRPSMDHLSR